MDMKALTNTLSVQLQLLEELLALLTRETREMSEMNLEAMAEINDRKEELTARIEAHAGPLSQSILWAVSREGLPANATLGDLAVKLEQKGNREIPRLQRDLNRMAKEIHQTASVNRGIAERFVATASTALNFLTRLINQSNVYGASGGYLQRPKGAVMINKEA
jgi:hypothetical protein